jgi:hypothetical protein
MNKSSTGKEDEASSSIRDAVKAVPSLGVIVALWFLALRYAFDNWQLVAALSLLDRGFLASIIAVLLALITYYLGNFWDHYVFDPLYSIDPQRGFQGKWLNTSESNFLGLLPSGRDLLQARERAVAALKLPSMEGVYAAAKEKLINSKKWSDVGSLLFLSKLCRSLIMPSFLIAAGLLTSIVYIFVSERRLDWMRLCDPALFVLVGFLLFIPYIHLRVKHMRLLYQRVTEDVSQ